MLSKLKEAGFEGIIVKGWYRCHIHTDNKSGMDY
jgi:hypothetical protein